MQGNAFRLSAVWLFTIGLFFARAAFAASDPPSAAGTLVSQTPIDHAPVGAQGWRISVKDRDHTTIAQRSQDETLAWSAERFGDRPAASDCDKILDSGEDRAKDPSLIAASQRQ